MLKSEKGCKPASMQTGFHLPGSPSQAGSKPGDVYAKVSTKQLVASRGLGGSNPPPGAFFKLALPQRLFLTLVLSFILKFCHTNRSAFK